VTCEHALTEFCSCIPRRPIAYVAEHVEMKPSGERIKPWSCQCRDPFTERPLRKGKRHPDRIACIPQEDVDAFKQAHNLTHDGVARALIYISTFAPKATP
jgi:hypothetical protein